MDAFENVLTEERQFFKVDSIPDLSIDTTRRIWQRGDDFYRFGWEVVYADGTVRRQYERSGSAVVQTLFARLSPHGIRVVNVFDFVENPPKLVAVMDQIPEDAEFAIYCTCHVPMSAHGVSARPARIYNFGFRRPNGGCAYLHIDPRSNPPRMWADDRR